LLSRVAIGRQQELIVISFRDKGFLLAATKSSISKVHSFECDTEPQESETNSL
jgi:flagellar biogenesis protein FliO